MNSGVVGALAFRARAAGTGGRQAGPATGRHTRPPCAGGCAAGWGLKATANVLNQFVEHLQVGMDGFPDYFQVNLEVAMRHYIAHLIGE